MSCRIDANNGRLSPTPAVEAGADPAQISTDRTGRYLLTAYYVAGKVSVHRIADDGSLQMPPHQEISTDTRAHSITSDAGNRFVFVPHTGPNAIFQFAWDPATGRLTPHETPKLQRPTRTGPRHLAWHPDKPWAYINNEQGSSVTAYRLGENGSLEPGNTVSTLPSDHGGSNSTAEIKIHPTGRYLYVANRGHDSLALFQVDTSGANLTPLGHQLTEKTPRSFDLDEQGRFLFVAGEGTGNLVVFRVDPANGGLTKLNSYAVGPMLWWVQTCRLP
jgi:6-phosphogluconolactonase